MKSNFNVLLLATMFILGTSNIIVVKQSQEEKTNTLDSVEVIKEFKRENPSELVQLLEKHHWNKSKVAKELGIGRTTLWRMLRFLK